MVPKSAEQPERRRHVLQAYRERASLCGLGRIFGVARQRVLKWLADQVEQLPSLVERLLPSKRVIFWNWMRCGPSSLSATTTAGGGQPGVGVLGKSSLLLSGIAVLPPADGCGKPSRPLIAEDSTYTDFWKAYQAVLPKRAHHPVGKETGQTAHQERWYLTLRQRVSRFVRKTLICSKSERNHELVTRWFIVQYNLNTSPIWVESECLKR